MNENFDKICSFVIDELEGGGTVVTDAGGVTRWGISKRWHPNVDIQNLMRSDAVAIYQREYWTPSGAPYVPWPTDLIVFDAAVNQGLTIARSLLRSTGIWQDLLLARLEAYVHLPGPLGDGWPNRLLRLWHYARQGEPQ